MTMSLTAMFGMSLSLVHCALQLGHLGSALMHLRMQIEQKVCEQVVMTGLERNSLQTSQRKVASSGSKTGSDVASQSVESGNSKPAFMSDSGKEVAGGGGCCEDAWAAGCTSRRDVASPASVPRSRVSFNLTNALSSTIGRLFLASMENVMVDCLGIITRLGEFLELGGTWRGETQGWRGRNNGVGSRQQSLIGAWGVITWRLLSL